jgi:hypothetical protein
MKLIGTVLLFSIIVLACTSCSGPPIKYYNPTESDIPSMIEDLSSEDGQESYLTSVAFGFLPKDARPKAVEALIAEIEKLEDNPRTFTLGEPIQLAIESFSDISAIAALGFMGPDASPAIPYLIELLEYEDFIIRVSVIRALGEIRCEPNLVIPVLRESLIDHQMYVREAAIICLVQYGEHVEIPDTIMVEGNSGLEVMEDFVQYENLISWCIDTLEDREESDIWLSVIDLLKTLGADSEPALDALYFMTSYWDDQEIVEASQAAIDEIESGTYGDVEVIEDTDDKSSN